MAKQYGLVLPKKNLSAPKAGNIFGHDDDSDEEEGTDWVKKALKAENEKNKIKKQTQINMQKALKEDPTIFQYDEVYDEIERTKEEKKVKKVEKKAKYIDHLLKTADLRKKEQELRKERVIQKEIEAEDAMFPDKERYVTSSYKAKLEEMKKFEEEQENQDRLEAIGDVTKQKDMSGFYRHLYRQTVERNDADLGIKAETSKESEKVEENAKVEADIDKDDPIPSSESESDNNVAKDIPKSSSAAKLKKKRQYRKRAQEASESESEPESGKQQKEKEGQVETEKPENTDDKDESESPSKKAKISEQVEDEEEEKSSAPSAEQVEKLLEKKLKVTTEETNGIEETVEEKPQVEEKVKINIWEKRTVGPVFEAVLQRYLMRKQERLAGS